MPVGGVSSSQNCGRMSGCNYVIRPWVLERHASFFGQAKFAPQEGLRGGRAQTNDDFRLDQFHFRLQPWLTGFDFTHPGLLVQSSFPALFELEMLHGVRYVGIRAVDGGIGQCPGQNAAGWSDKGMALDVFLISRLLTDEYEPSGLTTFAEDSLFRMQVEIAAVAGLYGLLKNRQGAAFRDEGACSLK